MEMQLTAVEDEFDIGLSAGYMAENRGENDPKQFGAGVDFE
jgi:hypothetical protein